MIGQSINNYQIRAQIGEGGMGTVYVAQHSFMGRKAAVKVLRRTYVQDEWVVSLFMNEARAANAIGHPNIIDIIDVGRLSDGQPYLMMEFLAGETLGARLARIHRLPTADALDFAEQAAGALAVAHEKGIVHRDLKPDNLFLIPDLSMKRGERVKVLDFGTAKLHLDAPSPAEPSFFGSPLYMSPEQCQEGATHLIDHRADIYALGALLYHALCGAPPFVADSVPDILAMHLDRAPTPPRKIDPEIPAHVEAVILRSLAKRPDDRFPSMAALVAALRDASLSGPSRRTEQIPRMLESITPRPALTGLSLVARPSRLRATSIAAACAVAILALWTKLAPPSSWPTLHLRAVLRAATTTILPSPPPASAKPHHPIIVPLPSPPTKPRPAPPRRLSSVIDEEATWGRRH
jgi:serine/threonine-protein kinase